MVCKMRPMRAWPLLLVALLLSPVATPTASQNPDDKAAIIQALLDYAEGYYGGEPARMTRALSPYLTKRQVIMRSGAGSTIGEMNADTLIEYSNGSKLAPEGRRLTTEVMEVGTETASARVFSAQFNDYVHLVKRDGTWRILNVLWHAPPAAASSSDHTAAVTEAVRSLTGVLTGTGTPDASSVIHPLAHVRQLARAPQNRPRFVTDQNAEALLAALARGSGKLTGAVEAAQIAVDGIDTNIAAARLSLGATKLYVHLALFDGRWRVVTLLNWTAPPALP
jgi:hypothetical protein